MQNTYEQVIQDTNSALLEFRYASASCPPAGSLKEKYSTSGTPSVSATSPPAPVKIYLGIQDTVILRLKDHIATNLVKISEIVRIQGSGRLLTLHTVDRYYIHFTGTLKALEQKLQNTGIVRVNHQTLVNLKHVKKIYTGKNRMIRVFEEDIPVSRRKWPVISQIIENMQL